MVRKRRGDKVVELSRTKYSSGSKRWEAAAEPGGEETRIENEQLLAENKQLRQDLERARADLDFYKKRWEAASEDADHWRKRYFLRDQEAQKFEQLLKLREAQFKELEAKVEKQGVQIAKLRQKVFGPQSEQQTDRTDLNSSTPAEARRKRGRQPGAPGYGRRLREELPYEDEVTDEGELVCALCGEQTETVDYEESDEVDVEVRAYRRKYRRRTHKHFCRAKNKNVIATAPVAPKLFPRAMYGIGFWTFFLVGKYYLQTPLNRLRMQLELQGLPVAEGTITAGLRRLLDLYRPLYNEIRRQIRTANHWHLDDTGWKVFVEIEGKDGHSWYLWVFVSQDACLYVLDPSRARKVPKSVLGDCCGIVTSDRLAANRKLGENIINSFCWVHERREFRALLNIPEAAAIAESWLVLIKDLFRHNGERLLCEPGSSGYAEADAKLKATLQTMQDRCASLLASKGLHPELSRILKGIRSDWEGLSLFASLAQIPPENNKAERALRNPVVGRKNYYGSYSSWSGELAAIMFSLHQTLAIHKVNFYDFHYEYMTACARNGGKSPPDADRFLPWHRQKTTSPPTPP